MDNLADKRGNGIGASEAATISAFERDYYEAFFGTAPHPGYLVAAVSAVWIGGALLVMWPFGYSHLKVLLAVFSTAIPLFLVIILLARQQQERRAQAIAEQSSKLRLNYVRVGPKPWLDLARSISAVPKWNQKQLQITNFVSGDYDGTSIVLFDTDTKRGDSDSANFAARVAVVPAGNLGFPDFVVQPRGFWGVEWSKLLATRTASKEAISDQNVLDSYKLLCDDETLITRFPAVFLKFLGEFPGWYVEKRGEQLIVACLTARPCAIEDVSKSEVRSFQISGFGLPPLKNYAFFAMGRRDKLEALLRQIVQIRKFLTSNSA